MKGWLRPAPPSRTRARPTPVQHLVPEVPPAPSSAGHTARHWTRMPPRYPFPSDTDAMVARIAPAVLALLGDGMPRSRRAIVTDARVECRRINGKLARIGGMLETLDAIVAKLGAPTVP